MKDGQKRGKRNNRRTVSRNEVNSTSVPNTCTGSNLTETAAGVSPPPVIPDRHADGAETSVENTDPETEELSRLRCSSLQTEVVSERTRRSQNRQPSAGYPGLALGSSIFSSNSIMKFGIIANELHNIMNVQLRRAEGEVQALNKRIQVLDGELNQSEVTLKSVTEDIKATLKDAKDKEIIEDELQNRNSYEDGHIKVLEAQLLDARLAAEESEKRFGETAAKIAELEHSPLLTYLPPTT